MRATLDIETALYDKLDHDGYHASAHVIPATLGQDLPHIHVVRTGGFSSDLILDAHNVDFDVYAADEADAMEAASALCGWICNLGGSSLKVPCYSSEVITLPYENYDPRHPNLGRATVKALIYTRKEHENA